ncbi:MAG TPA: hypothetical protein DHN33_07955 [Eubacteriaceae bacterium]|nr:hypothetical protein [Eubacteriaceae bacterium]
MQESTSGMNELAVEAEKISFLIDDLNTAVSNFKIEKKSKKKNTEKAPSETSQDTQGVETSAANA